MPECNYCDASFEAEGAYLEHLHADHEESELSRIDRRRVADHVGDDEEGEFPTGPAILGGVLLLTVGILVYVIFFLNTGGGGSVAASGDVNPNEAAVTPGQTSQAAHEHGTIEVTIAGTELDFTRQVYQKPRQYPKFHFEDDTGTWHKHAPDVTLQYAMATLGIWLTESSVRYDGTTYEDSTSGTDVMIRVNNESVDPTQYRLQEGDHVRIVVETN